MRATCGDHTSHLGPSAPQPTGTSACPLPTQAATRYSLGSDVPSMTHTPHKLTNSSRTRGAPTLTHGHDRAGQGGRHTCLGSRPSARPRTEQVPADLKRSQKRRRARGHLLTCPSKRGRDRRTAGASCRGQGLIRGSSLGRSKCAQNSDRPGLQGCPSSGQSMGRPNPGPTRTARLQIRGRAAQHRAPKPAPSTGSSPQSHTDRQGGCGQCCQTPAQRGLAVRVPSLQRPTAPESDSPSSGPTGRDARQSVGPRGSETPPTLSSCLL